LFVTHIRLIFSHGELIKAPRDFLWSVIFADYDQAS
jgi:hypothetical protein